MHTILADYTASISELKKSPTKVLNEAHGEPVAILNHNTPEAYLIPANAYEALIDTLEDIELSEIVKKRQGEISHAVEVNIDDL
jgi:antitoxin StbD